MAKIETNGYTFNCIEKFNNCETLLIPSEPFKIVPGKIEIWSEYARSIFAITMPKRELNENTWSCASVSGYAVTLSIINKKIVEILLIIPADELTCLCYPKTFLIT